MAAQENEASHPAIKADAGSVYALPLQVIVAY